MTASMSSESIERIVREALEPVRFRLTYNEFENSVTDATFNIGGVGSDADKTSDILDSLKWAWSNRSSDMIEDGLRLIVQAFPNGFPPSKEIIHLDEQQRRLRDEKIRAMQEQYKREEAERLQEEKRHREEIRQAEREYNRLESEERRYRGSVPTPGFAEKIWRARSTEESPDVSSPAYQADLRTLRLKGFVPFNSTTIPLIRKTDLEARQNAQTTLMRSGIWLLLPKEYSGERMTPAELVDSLFADDADNYSDADTYDDYDEVGDVTDAPVRALSVADGGPHGHYHDNDDNDDYDYPPTVYTPSRYNRTGTTMYMPRSHQVVPSRYRQTYTPTTYTYRR